MQANNKQLQFINTYSINNVGDAAIYAALFHLAKANGFETISAPGLEVHNEVLQAQLGAEISTEVFSNTHFLSVGGDIFNNARPTLITKQFLKNVYALSRYAKNTALFGQSIPRSCQGISFRLLAIQLKKLSTVVVRDQESFNRLQQSTIPAKLSYDTVFAAPINLDHQREVQEHFQGELDIDNLVVVSLRSFDHLYPANNERFLLEIQRLFALLEEAGLQLGIILQSKVDHADSDLAIINALNKTQKIKLIDPFLAHATLAHIAPWEIAQAIIAEAKLVIGIRYHTAIFRLLGGKMPFNIFYSNKGQDLQERLAVPSCSVADFTAEKYFSEIMATENQVFDARVITQQVSNDFSYVAQRLAQQTAF